jgi:hypothetical protein
MNLLPHIVSISAASLSAALEAAADLEFMDACDAVSGNYNGNGNAEGGAAASAPAPNVYSAPSTLFEAEFRMLPKCARFCNVNLVVCFCLIFKCLQLVALWSTTESFRDCCS